jgi:hypothetical protein
MDDLFRFPSAARRDPAVEAWLAADDEMRQLVRPWFERLRACGGDVRELIHDRQPTACAGEAAFAYVGAFRAHAAVGFFQGAALPDPAGLLQGTGVRMRHVRLRPGERLDEAALEVLIAAAYDHVRTRLRSGR